MSVCTDMGGAISSTEQPAAMPSCMCEASSKVLYCKCCGEFNYGKIAKSCPRHETPFTNVNLQCCSQCSGPKENLICFKTICNKYREFKSSQLKQEGGHQANDADEWIAEIS